MLINAVRTVLKLYAEVVGRDPQKVARFVEAVLDVVLLARNSERIDQQRGTNSFEEMRRELGI